MTSTLINTMGPGVVVERFRITSKDLTAAAASQALALKTLPKGSLILGARVRLVTPFAGGGTNSAAITLGTAGTTANGIMTTQNVFTGVAADTCYVATTTGLTQGTYAEDTFQATIATGNGNVSVTTAGALDVDLAYIPFEDLTGTAPVGNTPAAGGLL